MKNKMLLVIGLTLAAMAVATVGAQAATVYHETFDVGTTNGQLLEAAPLNWNNGSADLKIGSGLHPGWATESIDGTSGSGTGISTDYMNLFSPSTRPTTGVVTLSFDAWAHFTGGWQNRAYFGFAAVGDYGVRWGVNYYSQAWTFISNGIAPSAANYDLPSGVFMDKSVNAKIMVDLDNLTTWGSITDGVTTYTSPIVSVSLSEITRSDYPHLDNLRVFADRTDGGDNAMGIDNINVNAVPEPSGLLTLIVGGMGAAGLVLRRRK